MKFKNIIFYGLILFSLVPINLHCKVKAAQKARVVAQSKTSVKSKSSKVVNKSNNLNVGQLQIQVNQNATLEGLPVSFELGGYSTNNGAQSSFTGSYIPATGGTIVSNSSYQSLPGNVNYPLTMSGNATLEGIGNMSNGVNLSDPSTNLTINSPGSVNSSINLNGGTSTLQSDLNFGSDNQFEGEGTIEGNGNAAILGGKDLTITSTLSWINSDIVANSRLTLWGTWNLTGDIHVLGRGNVLDLSHGGKILIKSNTRVYVANLTIRGLGSRGTVQFQDDTGQLVLTSCTIELDDNYTFDKGGIYIDGPTTVITADKTLTFDTNASLTVDGVCLWYDTLTFDDNNNIIPTPAQDPNQKFIAYKNDGLIRASGASTAILTKIKNNSNAIVTLDRTVRTDSNAFAYGIKNNSNAIIFLSSYGDPALTKANSNAIVSWIKGTSNAVNSTFNPPLVSGNIYNNIVMNETYILNSTQVVNITNPAGVVLDGNGQTIVFNNTFGPQFVVQENVPVTLQNITLQNINQNTFNIKSGGQVLIGPNTTFEFSQDVTFSSGTFNVLDSPDGTVFTLASLSGNNIITFNDQATLNLGDNTLRLEDVELGSILNIEYGSANLIELASNASVDVDGNVGDPIGLNFKAIGENNGLTLMLDNLTLSGLVTFGDSAVNELAIRFVLENGLDPERVTAGEIYPIVNFTGGPGIMLGGSSINDARLILENPYTILNLLNSNAFLLDQNGQIFFTELELRENNIKQYSANVLIDGTRIIGHQIDSSFIRAYSNHKQSNTSKPTSKPKAKIQIQPKTAKVKTEKSKVSDTQKVTSKPKSSPKNTKTNFKDKKLKIKHVSAKNRKGLEDLNDVLGIEGSDENLSNNDLETLRSLQQDFDSINSDPEAVTLRSVNLPTSYDNVFSNLQLTMDVPPTGNILLTYSQINNLFTESNGIFAPFNITLKNHSMLSMADQDVILDPDNQIINVVGSGNVIEVQKTLTINNNLLLEENAELTIRFIQSGSEVPMVTFAENTSIDIEYKGILRFEGNGIVKLADGVVINLNGKKEVSNKKHGETVTIQRAQLIIHDGAILDFDENAVVNITGIGKISLQDRGFIKPSSACSLIIGSETLQNDDIDIEVTGSSEISLDLLESSASKTPIALASISLWNLTSNINFQNGGVLSIGHNSVFEINCDDSTLKSGNIQKFSFDGRGALFVKDNGTLRMAPNKIDKTTGWDYKLDWFGFENTINRSADNDQNGIIEFVNFSNKQSGSFIGIINPSNVTLYKDYYKSNSTGITFEKLASMLVNQKSDLQVSTLYNDPAGDQFVRTKNGLSVQLSSGDIIDSDNKDTGKIFGHNADDSFVILANGTRQ